MDNNNSLPYGAISTTNDNSPLHQRHFVPTERASASNDTQSFNPLLVARNVHLQSGQRHSSNIRNLNPSTRNSPYRIPLVNYNSNISPGQNLVSSTSTLSESDVSLIIDNNIPYRDINQGLHFSNQLTDTRIVHVPADNRYFHPPWTDGAITHTENLRVNAVTSLDTSIPCGRAATAPLPIIKEEVTPSGVNTSSVGCIETHRKHTGLKRRVSRDESDDGLPRPASKLLLTEEKMAAKMHNLRISNDHCYHVNGFQSHVSGTNGMVSNMSFSPVTKSDDDKDEHKEDDNNNMESGDSTMFVLAPGIKEALANNNELLPQSIIDHMSKPCLAVIPWKPQDDFITRISLNFNKTDDEKSAEKNTNYFESKVIGDTSHQQTVFIESVHTEAMDDLIETFEFDEDDMDL